MIRNILLILTLLGLGCGSSFDLMAPEKNTTPTDKVVLVKVDCLLGGGWGSGSIVNGDEVLTAYHVVDDLWGCQLTVKREGGEFYSAKVIKKNEAHDMALLKVDHDFGTTISLAPRNYLEQAATCIGFPMQPFDQDNTYLSISRGSVLTLDVLVEEGYRVNRIDTPIYFGSSGGPCFDTAGQLMGVVVLMHNAPNYFYTNRLVDIKTFLGAK